MSERSYYLSEYHKPHYDPHGSRQPFDVLCTVKAKRNTGFRGHSVETNSSFTQSTITVGIL